MKASARKLQKLRAAMVADLVMLHIESDMAREVEDAAGVERLEAELSTQLNKIAKVDEDLRQLGVEPLIAVC